MPSPKISGRPAVLWVRIEPNVVKKGNGPETRVNVRNVAQGRFIAVEGLDGAGTTTQVSELQRRLRSRGIEAYKTREPTSGAFGAVAGLHVREDISMNEVSMALGFTADRIDHLVREVEPQLERGIWVITDRYYLSTLAYQGVKIAAATCESVKDIDWTAVDQALSWIIELNRYARMPDMTVFLDVPPAVCAARARRERWHRERYDEGPMPYLADAVYRRAITRLAMRGDLIVQVAGAEVTIDELALTIEAAVVEQFKAESRRKANGSLMDTQIPFLEEE